MQTTAKQAKTQIHRGGGQNLNNSGENGQDLSNPSEGDTDPDKPGEGETDLDQPGEGETDPDKPGEGDTDPDQPGEGDTDPENPGGEDPDPSKPGEDEPIPDEEMVTIRFAPSDGGDKNYTILKTPKFMEGEETEVEEISVKKGSTESIYITFEAKTGYVIRTAQEAGKASTGVLYFRQTKLDGENNRLSVEIKPRRNGYTGDTVIEVEAVDQADFTLNLQLPEASGIEDIKVRNGEVRGTAADNTVTVSNKYMTYLMIKVQDGKIPLIARDRKIYEYNTIDEGYYTFVLGRFYSDADIGITVKDACRITFAGETSIEVVSLIDDDDYQYTVDYLRELDNDTTMVVKGTPFYFYLYGESGLGTISAETEGGEEIPQYWQDEFGGPVFRYTPETDLKIIVKTNPRAIPLMYAGGAVSDIEVIDIDDYGAKIADDKKALLVFREGEVNLRITATEGSELNKAIIYCNGEYEGEEDYNEEIELLKKDDGVYETGRFDIRGNINKIAIFGNEKVDQTVSASISKSSISVGEAAVISADGFGELTYTSSDPNVATVSRRGRVTGVAEGEAVITVNAAGDDEFNPGSTTLTVKVTPADGEFILYGAAKKLSDGSIQLTPDECDRKGSVWYRDRISTAGGLTATFSYQANGGYVADGIVLMLSEETGLGGEGDRVPDEGGGLAFLPGSYGVELDSYYNEGEDGTGVQDPTEEKHIAIVKDNVSNHLNWVEDKRVADGEWHTVSVIYSRKTAALRVELDGKEVLRSDSNINLPEITYVGISAATGDFTNEHLVKDFSVQTGAKPDDPEDPTPEDPAKNAVVTFNYPKEVSVTVNDYTLADNKITVETGKSISFKASLTDESYEISSVKANDADVVFDKSTGSYTLTINADTQIVITTAKKQTGTDPVPPGVSETGLSVVFTDSESSDTQKGIYTYTGDAVTPKVAIYYNGQKKKAGVDYTLKYSNNTNVSTNAKVIITGKGGLAGNHETNFQIVRKNINDPDVVAGSIKVVKNSKATPVLAYKGKLLTAKDYKNPKASTKFTADDEITIEGQGNFEGERTISVQIVDNKNALNKISVRLNKKENQKLTYDGTEKKPAFDVLYAKKNPISEKEEGTSYIVVYPNDIISAGTVKFTVVGIGNYTGSVTQSYKIKPSAAAASSVTVSGPDTDGYTFISTGVTGYRPEVKMGSTILTEGKDYTLTYSNNKKVGKAKCKVSFIGNYKGTKPITKEFKINPFKMEDFSADNIVIADKNSGSKPGIYKSAPYIIENGTNVLLKSSAFKLTYYVIGDPSKPGSGAVEMKGRDGKIQSGTVWVKIEPKNANYTGEPRYVSYKVRDGISNDLAKAKVTFTPNKISYTGRPIAETEVECNVTLNGTQIYNSKKADDKISVRYVNNVNKGKATAIIMGNGTGFTGVKTATFTIVASNIAAPNTKNN